LACRYVPAEQDGAIQGGENAGGFWYPQEHPKTVAELMAEYEDSVGHNANYLLELSPDPHGQIPAADVAAYKGFGQVRHTDWQY
jgi:alpha-L-fucosidase